MKTNTIQTYKTALMVSGDKEKFLQKVPSLECDIAILNLEDGVYDKKYARELVCKYIQKYKNLDTPKLVVRINSLDSYEHTGYEDIKALKQAGVKCIRVPKIKNQDEVKRVLELVNDDVEIHLSLETKEAFNNIKSLKVNNKVTTLYLGILDLLVSLELPQSLLRLDNPTIDYILSKYLIDSKSAGFVPYSFVFQDYQDIDMFERWLEKEYMIGFIHKSCISPSQIKSVKKIFDNSSEIARAKYIIKVFEENRAKGITGFSDELYGFIDEPIYKDALNTIKYNSF